MFDSDELTRMLEAVSEPVRMQIIFLLGDDKRLNVGEIARSFHISRPAISHHLKVLKDAGILRSQKSGQEVYYWVDSQRLVAALRALADKIERATSSDGSQAT